MRTNITLLKTLKTGVLIFLFSGTFSCFAQTCDPKWNRSKSSNCENSSVVFESNSSGISVFEWDFGDGTPKATTKDATHSFKKAGLYTVTFKGSSGTCTDTVMIFIRSKPLVNFSSTKPDSCVYASVILKNLTDTSLTKLKDIAKFVWDFGDSASSGNIISGDSNNNTSSYQTVRHRYDVSAKPTGNYIFSAKLKLTTKYGCIDSFSIKPAATANRLNIRLVNNGDSLCSPKSNKFTAIDISTKKNLSTIGNFVWNFGDPNSGTLNTYKNSLTEATHDYGLGPWMVSLNIKLGLCSLTLFDTIINLGPGSKIEIPNNRISENEKYQCINRDSIHFTNNSTFYHNDPYPKFEDSMTSGKQYVFKWPGDQTALPAKYSPISQRHKDNVLRVWDFGDNYAPKCTTDRKMNKNVGLNCRYSLDSLPMHWYTPWDQIYKYYNNGELYSASSEKTMLCKGGKYCFKANYYRQSSLFIPADTLVIVPKDSTFKYAGRTITPATKEITAGLFKIKKVPSKIKGQATYTPTLGDETWIFYTKGSVYIKNILTGKQYTTGAGTVTLKKGDQFELKKGDSAILRPQVFITAEKTITAQASIACIDTIIGNRDTFLQRSRVFIDSNFHRNNFYLKYSQCYNVTLSQQDTINALRCKSSNTVSLALVKPSARGLTFEGIKCYAPPSPPFGLTFSVENTKPGHTQRLMKFNFDSSGGKNNWTTHNGFLAPALPGSPWQIAHPSYAISGAWPNKIVMPYGAGQIQLKNPGWVTIGLIIGNGRLSGSTPECMDTVWYHNIFRYLFMDARFDVIQPEKTQKTICLGDTLTFKLIDPKMDSITSLVWNWNDEESRYYEERFFYYQTYPGPRPKGNDNTIKDWKKGDKWLYNYMVRLEYDGFKYKTLDTIVTAIIRKWSIAADITGIGKTWSYYDVPNPIQEIMSKAFAQLGLNLRDIPPSEIGYYLGNGSGKGPIDTTGLGNLIKFGVGPYRDALTFKRGTTWYRYVDYKKKDSVIVSQKLHWKDSSMLGFDTLKQATANKYSGLKVTPGVYRYVFKTPSRFFPTLQLRNTEGCFQARNTEVDVGYFNTFSFSDSIICGNSDIVMRDSIYYFAYIDPFMWFNPKTYWKDSKRLALLRETIKVDINPYDDTLTSKRFDITGLGPFKFHYDKPGKYTVRVATKDSLGCRDTFRKTLKIYPGLKTGFTVNSLNQCINKNQYTFEDTNSKVVSISRLWDFGDNTTSTLKKPSKTYTKSGTYNVKLIITSVEGCISTVSKTIVVYPLPKPGFTINTSGLCSNIQYTFTDTTNTSIVSFSRIWDFGDNTTSSLQKPNKTYSKSGTYPVKLIITSTNACKDTASKIITVYPFPALGFTRTPDILCQKNNAFALKDTTNQTLVSYNRVWDLGDGSNSAQASFFKNYKNPGTYNIKLKITTVNGCSDSLTKQVTILADPKIKLRTTDSALCFKSNAIKFSDSSSIISGSLKSEWNFGDGTNSTSRIFTKNYKNPGTYKVRLISLSNLNCADTAYKTINVWPEPKASFSFPKNNQCLKSNSFTFNNNSIIPSGTMSYKWYFGDSDSSTIKDPVKKYTTLDSFKVILIAKSDHKCTDDTSQKIYVRPQPVSAFEINDTAQCLTGNRFIVKNKSTLKYGTLKIKWLFADTFVLDSQSLRYSSPAAGIFRGKLAVTSNYNCTDTSSKQIYIFKQPSLSLKVYHDSIFCKGDSALLIAAGSKSYVWNNNSKKDSLWVNSSGKYSVSVTDTNGCSSQHSVNIKVNPIPPKPTIKRISKDTLESSYKTNNQWLKDGNKINGATNQKYGMLTYGIYSILYVDSNGCSIVSDTLGIRSGLKVLNLLDKNTILIYPNPTNDIIHIEFNKPYLGKIELLDLLGKVILETELRNENKTTLSIAHLAYGVYNLRIGNVVFKVMKL